MKRLFFPLLLVGLVLFGYLSNRTMQADTPSHHYYFPLVLNNYPPDIRFGVAQYGAAERAIIGLADGDLRRYQSQQWGPQEETNSAIFLRTAHRSHAPSRWCTGAYRFAGHIDYCADPTGATRATNTGWVNEARLCQWVKEHPRKAYIIGNELLCPEPCGDGVTATEYARWYADAWTLIKSCDPAARVSPFGPIGEGSKAILTDVWSEYHALTGEPLPVDFFPIHHYAQPGFRLASEIAYMERWIGWLNSHNPREWRWTGGPQYWLTEYGMPAWSMDIPEDEGLRYMREFTGWLKTNELDITSWAWWPHGELALVRNGRRTRLGDLYYELATTD